MEEKTQFDKLAQVETQNALNVIRSSISRRSEIRLKKSKSVKITA
jgi:hypothetical protein